VNCPKCGGKTKIDEVRPYHAILQRKRVCQQCDYIFETIEYAKSDKNTQIFRPAS
jgi:transcriptional regulator NrdR family protein